MCSAGTTILPAAVQIPTGQNLKPMQLNEMIALNGLCTWHGYCSSNDNSPPEVMYETDSLSTGRICDAVRPDGRPRSIWGSGTGHISNSSAAGGQDVHWQNSEKWRELCPE